ncbi:MAG: antitoxin Xre/MbcA/ParS toxin-binding domain-containing protein [Nitriliruptor sp.]|uniref:antitoxin Xre/MbcA/ParS toxin-binding domain-containing protein n=1 Tax=Nitriliruptor sp. TaxID=2448056 RepID=UPI0034A011EA
MYRDDPLDDEAELIAIAGEDAVETLRAGRDELDRDPLGVALDVLRVLQGWVDDDAAGRWLTSPQRRLESRTPVQALRDGAFEEVEDAAQAWVAANA